jgi:hypothetical protein
MPDRRARFAFEMDKKIEVTNKRVLARLASRHIYDSLAYAQRTLGKLEETILWLSRLNEIEDRLLSLDMMDDTGEGHAEQQLRVQALEALVSARKAISVIRERKSEVATQMEEDFDTIFKEQPKKVVQKPVEPTVDLKVVPVSPSSATPVHPSPILTPTGDPSQAVLNLDPALLAKARREISALAQEDSEN